MLYWAHIMKDWPIMVIITISRGHVLSMSHSVCKCNIVHRVNQNIRHTLINMHAINDHIMLH